MHGETVKKSGIIHV